MKIINNSSIAFNANPKSRLVSQSESILTNLAKQNKLKTISKEEAKPFLDDLSKGLEKIRAEFDEIQLISLILGI